MPILYAPLLEQAGFISSGSEPVVNYVARLDGISQYWVLSSGINLLVGDIVTFKVSYLTSISQVAEMLYGNNNVDRASRAYIDAIIADNPRVIIRDRKMSVKIDGNDVDNYPLDGLTHEIQLTVTKEFYVDSFCANDSGSKYFLEGAMHEFKVERGGSVVYEIPLTNVGQGATQLPTVGSVSTTMPNYTPDVWEIEP